MTPRTCSPRRQASRVTARSVGAGGFIGEGRRQTHLLRCRRRREVSAQVSQSVVGQPVCWWETVPSVACFFVFSVLHALDAPPSCALAAASAASTMAQTQATAALLSLPADMLCKIAPT